MKKKGKISPIKFRGLFLGGVVYRGTCVGGMLGNKRQDRGKKIQGARNFGGGDFLGKCQKRGGKTFWRFQKVVGIFLGVTTICWGRIFQEKLKKKNPGGGNLENCQ